MPRRLVVDHVLLLTAGLLVVAGLFVVGSASPYEAMRYGRGPSHYMFRHAAFAAIGLAAMLGTMRLPYRFFDETRTVLAIVSISGLALLAVFGMAPSQGAHRWIPLGPVNVQPSEFAKIAGIVFTAWILARREERVNELRAVLLPIGGVVGGMALLTLLQPDLGSAVMIVAPVAAMLFVAGLSWRYIGALATGAGVVFVAAILAEPYRLTRIGVFIDPTKDPQGAGFQATQSLLALGSGGITGVGFGQGQQKAWFLPAAHTDFVFSVVGEELGLFGTGLLLAAVLVLFWRGLRTSLRVPDRFARYLALGLTLLVVLQALVHMAVCVVVLPTKGLPFPYLSYGGSSLIATLAATGILVNLSQHAR